MRLKKIPGTFSDILPSDRTMALRSTQPLVKMSTRNIPEGKGGRCVRLTTYHHTVPLSRNLGALTSSTPLGLRWPVTGVLYLYHYIIHKSQHNNTKFIFRVRKWDCSYNT